MTRPRELVLLYEATFLNLTLSFESFQEELFFTALLNRSKINGVRPVLSFVSRSQAEQFVLASEKTPFLSWTKSAEVLNRAKKYLAGGRPFSRLERRDRDTETVARIFTVRNAIAHRSGPALVAFSRLPGADPQRPPGEFLRQLAGTEIQHEILCREVLRIAKALAAKDVRHAKRLLLPERPFKTGEPLRGRIRCIHCAQVVTATGQVPHCPNCNLAPCPTCGSRKKSEFERN